ncbi:MAG: hypothetical protein ACRDLL_16580 [Solirubrobacterales bacterium]
MELRDVAERGKAPRGSIYHHFPRRQAPARRRCDHRLPQLGTANRGGLLDEGLGRLGAETFVGLVVSTVEGALIRARAAGDTDPLDSAIGGLGQALDRLLEAAR